VKRRTWYDLLAATTLAVAGLAAILAIAGAAFQQALSVAAATLCAIVFLIPGLYFFTYAHRLRSRDLALVHTAAFANARGVLEVKELATELAVSPADAEKILRTAIREGHLRGRFDDRGRFVSDTPAREPGVGRT
jgi:hypothetical protein